MLKKVQAARRQVVEAGPRATRSADDFEGIAPPSANGFHDAGWTATLAAGFDGACRLLHPRAVTA